MILGGGFAGLFAARALRRTPARERTFTTREVGVVRDVYSGEPN